MKFLPELAQNADPDRLDEIVNKPAWSVQQKFDGVRLMIVSDGGKLRGINRKGSEVELDRWMLNAFGPTKIRTWAFDGEYLPDGKYVLFDMPYVEGWIDFDTPYYDRRKALLEVYKTLNLLEADRIVVCAEHRGTTKFGAISQAKELQVEGVMLRHDDAKYTPGLRNPKLLKLKFLSTVDCIVSEVGRENKRSISVEVYAGSLRVDVGSVSVTEAMLDKLKVGDVVEVKYLFATDANRLYQPRFVGIRLDKDASECSIEQLRFTNRKSII